MSKQQPEALLLADELQAISKNPWAKHWERCLKAAAELRRLHALNTELLEALKELDSWLVCACIATPEDMAQSFPHMQQVVSAAIFKATGEA
jgi:hypothetical protein